ncbi:MAG: hypothetical protein KBE27_06695 [Syntrophorhabdaceae bacterium]|nr:hypothetical protein [Syntrophorhabdales bacterium]MBP9561485.1 hypothetical protein [Syntrophorhabdaceae bacterium]
MRNVSKVVVNDFEKKPDGSWVVVKNSDVFTDAGEMIRLAPGMTFVKGRKLWGGIDLAHVLDEVSKN